MKKVRGGRMNKTDVLKLNGQYIGMQMPYWMGYSVLSTFTSVFLLSRAVTNGQIGVILALANLLAAVVQPFLATFADRMTKLYLSQLAALMAGGLIFFAAILLIVPDQLLVIGAIYLLLYASLLLLQPLTISIGTFFISRGYSLNFGVARGLGSLAFAGAATVAGILIKRFSPNVILYLLIAIFLLFAVVTLTIDTRKSGGKYSGHHDPIVGNESAEEPIDLLSFAKKYRRFMLLIVGVSLLFVFHNIVNNYMYQIMQPLGGNTSDVGASLSIAALFELPTMFLFLAILKFFKVSHLMRAAALFFSIKAAIILLAGNIFMINLAQSLQMTGFALHTMASVYYTNQIIPQKDLVKGQTLMIAANTVGGIVGSFLGGQLLSFFSVYAMLLVGTIISIAGTLLVWVSVEDATK